jgi:putative endonuclease
MTDMREDEGCVLFSLDHTTPHRHHPPAMSRPIVPAVYILASRRNGTLYIGVTSELCARIAQHKAGEPAGFTSRHGVTLLVHAEFHDTMEQAIAREKELKRWRRDWKIALIERGNPAWRDLAEEMCGPE